MKSKSRAASALSSNAGLIPHIYIYSYPIYSVSSPPISCAGLYLISQPARPAELFSLSSPAESVEPANHKEHDDDVVLCSLPLCVCTCRSICGFVIYLQTGSIQIEENIEIWKERKIVVPDKSSFLFPRSSKQSAQICELHCRWPCCLLLYWLTVSWLVGILFTTINTTAPLYPSDHLTIETTCLLKSDRSRCLLLTGPPKHGRSVYMQTLFSYRGAKQTTKTWTLRVNNKIAQDRIDRYRLKWDNTAAV